MSLVNRGRASRIATDLLLWYARHVPYHRGKERLSQRLRSLFGVAVSGECVERREGLWWSLDRADWVCQDLYWASAKNRSEMRQVFRWMPAGGVMLDVGANFGYYSIVTAARLRQQCTIHAFEPSPEVFARLQRNVELNGSHSVAVHRLALADRVGAAGLVPVTGNSGSTYLSPGDEVPVSTVDRFCTDRAMERLDVIKIDAEGSEWRILRGATGTLERFQPAILLELHAEGLKRDGATPQSTLGLLADLGYRFYSMKPYREIFFDSPFLARPIANVLCLPREQHP